jgi:hypothetical protein
MFELGLNFAAPKQIQSILLTSIGSAAGSCHNDLLERRRGSSIEAFRLVELLRR